MCSPAAIRRTPVELSKLAKGYITHYSKDPVSPMMQRISTTFHTSIAWIRNCSCNDAHSAAVEVEPPAATTALAPPPPWLSRRFPCRIASMAFSIAAIALLLVFGKANAGPDSPHRASGRWSTHERCYGLGFRVF